MATSNDPPAPEELPDARWGTADTPLPAVTPEDDDDDPDDEELAETPADVIAMLGFDPLHADDDDEAEDDDPFTAALAQDEAEMAFDRSVRSYDQDGRLHVAMCNISKAVINPYYGHEIPDGEALGLDPDHQYRLYRAPEELAAAARTFNNIPVLSRHMPITADSHQPGLTVGSTGTDAIFEAPYLRNSLVIWSRDAIDAIERDDRRQLSAAYRYRADMTPGSVNGARYDGVMRDIRGNHIALVPEGRAGSDVVVGDAKPKETTMPAARPKPLSRQALFVSAAVCGYAMPKLATDQKMPDLRPLLRDVTVKNWKQKRPVVEGGLLKLFKPRLAQDASMETLHKLLDGFESPDDGGGAPAPEDLADAPPPDDGGGEMPAPEDDDDGGGAEAFEGEETAPEEMLEADTTAGKLMQFLTSVLTPEELAQAKAIAQGGGGGEQEAPPAPDDGGKPPIPPDDNAKDQEPGPADQLRLREEGEQKKMVTKPAMDAAIQAAVKAERARALAVRDAEAFVRPFIGNIAIAQDSAEGVYKAALDCLGVKVEGVHPTAYRAIL